MAKMMRFIGGNGQVPTDKSLVPSRGDLMAYSADNEDCFYILSDSTEDSVSLKERVSKIQKNLTDIKT